MKILKLCLVFGALALFIFSCSGNGTNGNSAGNNSNNKPVANNNSTPNAQPTAADELAATKKIYQEKCVRCHKDDGTGGETEIDGTKIKAPNFNTDRLKKDPDSELIESIEKGVTDEGMPAFKGKISDDEIKKLVKLIRRDFQKQ